MKESDVLYWTLVIGKVPGHQERWKHIAGREASGNAATRVQVMEKEGFMEILDTPKKHDQVVGKQQVYCLCLYLNRNIMKFVSGIKNERVQVQSVLQFTVVLRTI